MIEKMSEQELRVEMLGVGARPPPTLKASSTIDPKKDKHDPNKFVPETKTVDATKS
jgi:hypothetical protein